MRNAFTIFCLFATQSPLQIKRKERQDESGELEGRQMILLS